MAPRLLAQSMRMLFRNIIGTLHVTLGLFLLSQAIFFLGLFFMIGGISSVSSAGFGPAGYGQAFTGDFPMWSVLGFLAAVIVSVVLTTWMAIAWHRFALVGTKAFLVPAYPKNTLSPYFWRSLGISVLILLPLTIATETIKLLTPTRNFDIVLEVLASALFMFFFLRLALGLPGLSVGKDLSMHASFEYTGPVWKSVATVSFLIAGISVFLSWLVGDSLTFTLISNWFTTLLGLSMLTTMYRAFVEQRTQT